MVEWVVIKVGGGVAEKPALLHSILADVRGLREAGISVVLLHGGGPQATRIAGQLGYETKMVGGRRVTDANTLEVMKMVLGGLVATDILAACRAQRVRAVHVSGVSDRVILAQRRPPRFVSGGGTEPVDFGHVGDIVSVDPALIHGLGEQGIVPVLNSLGATAEGSVLNINADIAATKMAVALKARALFLLTGAPGVLRDAADPTTRIPTLSLGESQALISAGTIAGGMIPKLEESYGAIQEGLGRVHILQAESPGGIRREWESPGSVGTALVL